MISLLVPSRNRPENILRLHRSVVTTTSGPWELVIRLDDDDDYNYPILDNTTYLEGPRNCLSTLWNDCYNAAGGNILWHGGDDVIFSTPGWDVIVRDAIPADNIAFVHGDDLGNRGVEFGTHGFLARTWVEAVGYFCPPYFTSDYNDRWFNDIANILDRRVYRPFITEHLHPGFEKAPWDATYEDNTARAKVDRPDLIYARTAPERLSDAMKLLTMMDV